MIGQNYYNLTCLTNGAENIDPSVSYIWFKSYGTQSRIQLSHLSNTLSFSNLSLSDAGQYTCQATVTSPYLFDDIIVMKSQVVRIHCKRN